MLITCVAFYECAGTSYWWWSIGTDFCYYRYDVGRPEVEEKELGEGKERHRGDKKSKF